MFFFQFETIGSGSIVGKKGQKKKDTSPNLQNDNVVKEKMPNESDSPDSGRLKRGLSKDFIRKINTPAPKRTNNTIEHIKEMT